MPMLKWYVQQWIQGVAMVFFTKTPFEKYMHRIKLMSGWAREDTLLLGDPGRGLEGR